MLFPSKYKKSVDTALEILAVEDELWINYSAGINHQWNLSRSRKPPRYKGLLLQLARMFLFVFSKTSFVKQQIASTDTIFFVETANQWSALSSTVSSLHDKGDDVLVLVDDSSADVSTYNNKNLITNVRFSPDIVFIGLILLLKRFAWLYKKLKHTDRRFS